MTCLRLALLRHTPTTRCTPFRREYCGPSVEEVKMDTFVSALRLFLAEHLKLSAVDVDLLFTANAELGLRTVLDQVSTALELVVLPLDRACLP